MYEEFYGLNDKPFSLLPDPQFLYLSPKHEIAMSILEYAVHNDLVLSVVTGEVGAGKTTLIRTLLNDLADTHTIGLISNTTRDFANLMQNVAACFDLPFADKTSIELHQDFVQFLIDEYAAGRRTLLIVDEAQNLDASTLEDIRLLTNINADEHTLLQLVLVGQPELHDLLKRHDLRQLAQRISVFAKLEPLNEKDTFDYIQHRIKAVGGDPRIFHKNAMRLVYWNSEGIPRVINTLCELALVYGYADGKKRIDAELIADIARDRIDTGLYGDRVFDVKSLENIAARRKARRSSIPKRPRKNAPPLDNSTLSGTDTALRADDSKIFDLVVDGKKRKPR